MTSADTYSPSSESERAKWQARRNRQRLLRWELRRLDRFAKLLDRLARRRSGLNQA